MSRSVWTHWSSVSSSPNPASLGVAGGTLPDSIGDGDPGVSDLQSHCYLEGHQAYVASFARELQLPDKLPRFFFYSPFLLYLAQIAAFGTRAHARIILQLGIVKTLRTLGPSGSTHQVREALAPGVLLDGLVSKLSPVSDADTYYPSVAEYFWELHSTAERSVQTESNGLWSWVTRNDQDDGGSLDVGLDANLISDAIGVLNAVFLHPLEYVKSNDICVLIIGREKEGIHSLPKMAKLETFRRISSNSLQR
uniref:Uncharacterized protein n=1 Tax=Moniliophthora roreri TaxID=221103 RepID=A0A0W0F7V8_MONRR